MAAPEHPDIFLTAPHEDNLLEHLPDETLSLTLQRLAPEALGCLASTSSSLARWMGSAAAAPLWHAHCARAGLRVPNHIDCKVAYGCHAATRCMDCRRPTRYIFQLLQRRLCESCERQSPQRYAIATELQLVHERSSLAMLSAAQRRGVLRSLPSIELGGAVWYLRRAAVAAASQLESDDVVSSRSACATGDDVAQAPQVMPPPPPPVDGAVGVEVVESAEEADEDDEEHDENNPDAAGAEHAPIGAAGSAARRAEQREAAKAHKRAVKAAARAKREGGALVSELQRKGGAPVSKLQVRSKGSPRGASAPASTYKPKRASAREHRERAATELTPWERQYRGLEETLGADLCGLSGLVLALDR